jgi:hypothetical protein
VWLWFSDTVDVSSRPLQPPGCAGFAGFVGFVGFVVVAGAGAGGGVLLSELECEHATERTGVRINVTVAPAD